MIDGITDTMRRADNEVTGWRRLQTTSSR